MTDPLRLRDLEREMKGFAEAWLHDAPWFKKRLWLSVAETSLISRAQILAHAVREP